MKIFLESIEKNRNFFSQKKNPFFFEMLWFSFFKLTFRRKKIDTRDVFQKILMKQKQHLNFFEAFYNCIPNTGSPPSNDLLVQSSSRPKNKVEEEAVQNTMNIEKINKGCMRTRKLSHLAQTAIGSNGWIRKTLCNRLFGLVIILMCRFSDRCCLQSAIWCQNRIMGQILVDLCFDSSCVEFHNHYLVHYRRPERLPGFIPPAENTKNRWIRWRQSFGLKEMRKDRLSWLLKIYPEP